MQRMGFLLEPRIIEHMAVFGYRIAGGEYLWIPRVLSSIFWVIGGIFLYLVAKKIATPGAALFSTIFYLFLPYGILASRSFQPDPLMIMLLLTSLFTILWNHEKPSKIRLFTSAGISALAILIKPYCIFLIFGVLTSLSIKRQGIWKSVRDPNVLAFSSISVIPAFVYYSYGALGKGDPLLHAQITFLPHLLWRPYFWKDWLIMIGRVTGYIAFAGAFLGFLISRGLVRIVLAGLWIGYFIFGVIFTYHIHTHDYYHLQFIPIVAFSLVPVAAVIIGRLSRLFSTRNLIILAIVSVIFIISGGIVIRYVQLRDYKDYFKPLGAVIGVNPQFYQFITDDYKKEVRIAKEIGKIVGHSTNTVFLTPDFGRSLTYHAEFSGLPWPISSSLQERKEGGVKAPQKEEFNIRYLTIRTHGKYIKYTPDYFIITDFEEFEKQPDLKDFLFTNFPLIAQSSDYLIFDLRVH